VTFVATLLYYCRARDSLCGVDCVEYTDGQTHAPEPPGALCYSVTLLEPVRRRVQ